MKLCECGCGRPVPIAKRTNRSRGHIKGQPIRFVKGHQGRTPDYTIEDRGYLSPCWVWAKGLHPTGYGSLGVNESWGYGHRVYYERSKGPIPAGLHIDHLCRVRACVNPDHLEAVTQQENIRRGAEAITHCRQGHPYDESNTYRNKDGHRTCRTCRRDGMRRKLSAERLAA